MTYKHYLQIYQIDLDEIKFISDIYLSLNKNTDFEIKSVIIINNKNNKKINLNKSNNNFNCKNKFSDYFTLLLINK